MAYRDVILATNPTSWWRLNEGGAGAAADQMGQNAGTQNGTITRGATGNTPDGDAAMGFDGASAFISTAKQFVSPGPQSPYSVALSFRTAAAGPQVLSSFGDSQLGGSASIDRYLYIANDNKLYAGIYPTAPQVVASGRTVNDGLWHRALMTVDPAVGLRLYLDGILQGTNAAATGSIAYGGWWRFGAGTIVASWPQITGSGIRYLNGGLDEVMIYPYVMTQAQVTADYAATASVWTALVRQLAPIGWWRLGDAVGTMAADSTANANHGTTVGTVTMQQPGLVVGEVDKAALFVKSGVGRVMIGNPGIFGITTGTILAFFSTTDATGAFHALLAKQNAYGLFVSTGRLVIYDWGSGALRDSAVGVADGGVHMGAVTFQSGIAGGTILYLDGLPVMVTTMSVLNQTVPLDLSYANASQHFDGPMDEAMIFSRVLNPAEILSLWGANRKAIVQRTGQRSAGQGAQSVIGGQPQGVRGSGPATVRPT